MKPIFAPSIENKNTEIMTIMKILKIKRKPIWIITSYCRKNFKLIRHVSKGNCQCTLFTSLLKSCSIKIYSTIS